jgi:O-methyltransferase
MKLTSLIRGLWRALRGHPWYRYRIAEKISGWLYPTFKFSEFGRSWLEDREFLAYYETFHGRDNYHSLDRKYVLAELMKAARQVAGDTAECGAYQGASSWLICRAIQGLPKEHHVFDSFQGLSRPGERDGAYWKEGDLKAGEDEFRSRMKDFANYRVHSGWIPERFPHVADRTFCFVHVDVDLHKPTLDTMEFFYPRMSPRGMMLLDDYGFTSCPGVREAIDGFMKDKPEPVLSLPTGQGLVIRQG